MTALLDRYVAALKAVNEIMEHRDVMCRSPDRIPVSIDDLVWVVEQYAEVTVALQSVSFESAHLSGALELYDDRTAKIFVRSDLSTAEKRLVAVKELAHLIIDGDDAQSTLGVDTIRSLVSPPALPRNGDMDPCRLSENLALVIAVELLYPHEYRREDRRKMEEADQTEASLAMYYDIPSFVIGHSLQPEWLDAMDRCWGMVRS